MASPQLDVIAQLNTARKLALGSSSDYLQLISSVLPVLSPNADIALRRWGADLLAEAFSAPILSVADKENLLPAAIPVISGLLKTPIPLPEVGVAKGCIQASASLYPILLRYCASNPSASPVWTAMSELKNRIVPLVGASPGGVNVCCVKFCQRVVLSQTAAQVDPRTQHLQTDVSVSVVPRGHPFLDPVGLEQEAMGLLSRVLTMMLDMSTEMVVLVAILNTLSATVRSRPKLLNVVLEAVLTLRPFAGIQRSLSSSSHVAIRSIERTTRLMLKNIMAKFPSHPMTARVRDYLAKLERSHVDLLEQASRKRSAPSDPSTGAKRQKTGPAFGNASEQAAGVFPPLPEGPISLAQLITLTTVPQLSAFDVKTLPVDVVSSLLVPLLQSIDERKLSQAVDEVVKRCHLFNHRRGIVDPREPAGRLGGGAEDEDDLYEPTLPTEKVPALSGSANALPAADDDEDEDFYAPAPIPTSASRGAVEPLGQKSAQNLPQPNFLPPDVAAAIGSVAVDKLLARMDSLSPEKDGKAEPSFAYPAPAGNDRNSWVTFLARAANRADAGLDPDLFLDDDDDDGIFSADTLSREDLATGVVGNTIREGLLQYVLQDFRQNIVLAIAWLSEEWLHDKRRMDEYNKLIGKNDADSDVDANGKRIGRSKKRKMRRQRKLRQLQEQKRLQAQHPAPDQNYKRWAIRLVDGILPFLESRDKVLIRLLSDLPLLDRDVLSRVQKLAEDPDRVGLCTQALQYLIMLRTPVREVCLDIVEDLWKNYDDARPHAQKILMKWRPTVVHKNKQLKQAPVVVDRTDASNPGDGLPWD